MRSASAFLKKLAEEGGAIVKASICHPIEIEKARKEARVFEDKDGETFIHRHCHDFPTHYETYYGEEARTAVAVDVDGKTECDPEKEFAVHDPLGAGRNL